MPRNTIRQPGLVLVPEAIVLKSIREAHTCTGPHEHPYSSSCAVNYSQQELSDRFTMQPEGINIHTLKLASAASSRLRLTTAAHTHTHTTLHITHPELLTPAEVGWRVYTPAWQGYGGGGTPRG